LPGSPTSPRTVLLVDDHDLIRQGLARAFERAEDLVVVGQAGSVTEGLALSAALAPDVVVSDVRLPDGSGLELVRRLRGSSDRVGLVVLTMYAGDEQLFAAMEAGASAFVAKDVPATEVVAAARRAVVGPTSFTATGLAEALRRRMSSPRPQLSPRELEVLGYLAEGLGISAISRRLYISESTTKTHITKIYEKLGAGNRAQAMISAVRAGLLTEALADRNGA